MRDAINVPKPIQQPRVPIMVGGNGPNVTWRLAARYADELNVDGMSPDEVARGAADHPRPAARRSAATRRRWPCRSTSGRRPSAWPGPARVDRLAGYREVGVSRVMGLDDACATTDEALESLALDARQAGVDLV